MTSLRWVLLSGLVMWVATCGQKGPLQLPQPTETQNELTTSLNVNLWFENNHVST